MAYLLDTHTFLWFMAGDSQLPSSVRDRIIDIQEPCFLSIASLWEITIKEQIGKLTLKISLAEMFEFVDRNQIEIISIKYDHLLALSKLPTHHSDPFDRIIVSQAITEDIILLSKDAVLKKYKARLQWS